jgi:outer membrane protein assembly factor BamB
MHVLRFARHVLLSALCLAVLLVAVPSVQAHSLTSAQPLTCPRITGFTPQSGTPGTSVTLTGCGFTGTTSVAFHGVVASFTVNSDTQITTSVPAGALSGPITVTTSSITVKSPGKFLVPPALTLSSTVGPPTSSVTVSGSNFGHAEGVDVYFDTTDEALASTTVQGQFSISIQVPAGAVPGTHWVTAVGRHSGLSAQASFLVQTDWTAFHNLPTHTGINPYENVLSPTNVGKLDTSWSATTGSSISSPAVANGVVYVGSGYDLYAFNAQTGAQLWSAPTGYIIESSPAVANNVVYVGSDDDHLYAFNAQTGAQLWSTLTGNIISPSPAVANGMVYVSSADGYLYAYALPPGDQLKPPARPNPASLKPNLKLPVRP